MADIVLKDRDGKDITYPGINSIRLKTADGGTREFLHGETAEKTVAPDFSGGDMEIPADGGTFLTKVTIEKPEDLLPENIREGKEIGGVAGSAFVVDMVETVILEEKTYDDFSEVEGTGIYAPSFAYEFNFVVGETYHVVWDDAEYVCVAYEVDGLIGVGNAAIAGMGEDTGEPFLMGDNGWVAIATLETDASHVIGVSQKVRGDVETADVELSLADGDQEVTPSASGKVLTKVSIKKPETLVPANIAKGVEVAGVVGELVAETEEVTVELDFSDGDMEVTPTADKTFSKVSIPVPETLIPENIAEGVNIAGIIGALAAGGGGGGNVKVATGYIRGGGTVTHNLGVIPDIIVAILTYRATTSGNYANACMSFSKSFSEKHTPNGCFGSTNSSGKSAGYVYGGYGRYGINAGSYHDVATSGYIYNVTETTAYITSFGATAYTTAWLAIGGLT